MDDMDVQDVIDRFNQAFQERDATLLEDIIAPDCVMESVQPAPDGTRYEGYDASFGSWKALIDDTTSHFEVEAAGYSKTAPTVAALEG